jgi:hypothetical protein
MTTPNAVKSRPASTQQAQRQDELRQAEADFERGTFVDLTMEEIDRCLAVAGWPRQDEPVS